MKPCATPLARDDDAQTPEPAVAADAGSAAHLAWLSKRSPVVIDDDPTWHDDGDRGELA